MAALTINRIWRIYKVTCAPTAKSYVGLTVKSVENRWDNHVWRAGSKRPLSERMALHRAIKKYGAASFLVETLSHHDSLEEASAAEVNAIAAFNTLAPNGYNITIGGMGTPGFRKKHSAEARAKISVANKNRIVSPKTRAKMAASARIRITSDATRQKRSVLSKSRNHPPEYYAAMSKAKTGNPVPIKVLRWIRKALAKIDAGLCRNYRPEHGKFSTRISIGAKKKHLGMFASKEMAIAAYRAALEQRLPKAIEEAKNHYGQTHKFWAEIISHS